MGKKSSRLVRDGKAAKTKPDKPYPDYPLFAHASGRWAKKIKGKTRYFGSWDDPQGALDRYIDERDDLQAGRTPQRDKDGLSLAELVNDFLSAKKARLEAKHSTLSPQSFIEYNRVCGLLVDAFGRNRAVSTLGPKDFSALYNRFAEKYGVITIGKLVVIVRGIFKYGHKMQLTDKVINFGPQFEVPSKKDKRLARADRQAKHGLKMFEAENIRAMLDAASPQLKCMILLGINGALGNSDISALPTSAIDFQNEVLVYPRGKTGIERRIPLWSETLKALEQVIAKRKTPVDEADQDLVFVTKYGQRWVRYEVVEEKKFGRTTVKAKQDDAIAKATAKLLRGLGIKRRGVGFYALRSTFETVAGGSRDQVAVNAVMGHADATIADVYRETIDDDRLRAVVNHVHDWLFPPDDKTSAGSTNGTVNDDAQGNGKSEADDKPGLKLFVG